MANYDVEFNKHIHTEKMLLFLFLAPYARTTRYEERFFRLMAKSGLGRFAPSALPHYKQYRDLRVSGNVHRTRRH